MLKFPPEVVLRPLARTRRLAVQVAKRNNGSNVTRSLSAESTSATYQRRFFNAAMCTGLGKPLTMSKVAAEEINGNQVRVKVFAAAVSFADMLTVQGIYQEKREPPFIPGTEFSGVVTEVGPDVKDFTVGSRICALSFNSAAFAEEAIVNDSDIFIIPDNMSFTQAAGVMSSYGTAILALEGKGNIKKGEKVLVTAAAGSVGLAAVDLAKNVYGAEVIGAAGGPEKCQLLRELGAEPIDYKTENIRDKVRSMHPAGVDIVFEAVGGDIFKDCFRSLAPDGRLLVIGFTSGKYPSVAANHMLVKNVSVLGVYWGIYKILNNDVFVWTVRECFRHFKDGKINPRISATFKLQEINQAFAYIQARKARGKVVLVME